MEGGNMENKKWTVDEAFFCILLPGAGSFHEVWQSFDVVLMTIEATLGRFYKRPCSSLRAAFSVSTMKWFLHCIIQLSRTSTKRESDFTVIILGLNLDFSVHFYLVASILSCLGIV